MIQIQIKTTSDGCLRLNDVSRLFNSSLTQFVSKYLIHYLEKLKLQSLLFSIYFLN